MVSLHIYSRTYSKTLYSLSASRVQTRVLPGLLRRQFKDSTKARLFRFARPLNPPPITLSNRYKSHNGYTTPYRASNQSSKAPVYSTTCTLAGLFACTQGTDQAIKESCSVNASRWVREMFVVAGSDSTQWRKAIQGEGRPSPPTSSLTFSSSFLVCLSASSLYHKH